MSVAAAANLRARPDRPGMYGIAGWHAPQAPGSAIGEEEPDINLQLFGVPLAEQLKGLQHNLFDVGFDSIPEEPMACPANRCCRPNWLSPSPLAMLHPESQSELHRIVVQRRPEPAPQRLTAPLNNVAPRTTACITNGPDGHRGWSWAWFV